MDNYIIINKFFILIYCIISYIEGDVNRAAPLVALILLYTFINVTVFLISSKSVKTVLYVVSLILGVYLSYSMSLNFILLIIPNILEIVGSYTVSIVYGAFFLLLPCFVLDSNISKDYFIVSILSSIIVHICQNSEIRFKDMSKQIDKLRREKDKLRKVAALEEDYKSQLLYAKQLEERNNIAQEIHDSLGHAIIGSVMQLEAAKLLIDKDKEKAAGMVQSAIETLRSGMDNIRLTLRNIKPSKEQLGINKLKLFIDEFKRKSSLDVKLTYNGDINVINMEQWKCIYDNAVEALTNAVKYSKSTKVVVAIEVLNKIVKVEYKDNGIGTLKINKGLGLRGIEDRCISLGGKLILDGSKGFSIIILMPIENN